MKCEKEVRKWKAGGGEEAETLVQRSYMEAAGGTM